MAFISNVTTILDAGSFASGAVNADQVLIKTLTASSSANLTFVHGTSSVVLDGTYPIYRFVYTSMHPATNGTSFDVNFRDGDTNYDAVKTTTMFEPIHKEDGTGGELAYQSTQDRAQSTDDQKLLRNCGDGADETSSGDLWLFNPNDNSKVTLFIATGAGHHQSDYTITDFVSGYCNTTTPIDGVRFQFDSGNIDSGTIKLYGIKDS